MAVVTVPLVEDRGSELEVTVQLQDGTHIHAVIAWGDLVGGGVVIEPRRVRKVHRGAQPLMLHEALGIDGDHLHEGDRVWLPGHRIAAVILRAPSPRRRAVGFAVE